MPFGKPPNPLLEDWKEGYEEYCVTKLEAKMHGAIHFPSKCGCIFKPSAPGRARVIRRCARHQHIEPTLDVEDV